MLLDVVDVTLVGEGTAALVGIVGADFHEAPHVHRAVPVVVGKHGVGSHDETVNGTCTLNVGV